MPDIEAAKKQPINSQSKTIVSDKVRDYSNDPFFIEKAKASKAFLDKHGFTKDLVVKR